MGLFTLWHRGHILQRYAHAPDKNVFRILSKPLFAQNSKILGVDRVMNWSSENIGLEDQTDSLSY